MTAILLMKGGKITRSLLGAHTLNIFRKSVTNENLSRGLQTHIAF